MSETKVPCCEDAIDKLIVNSATRFTSSDKEWLMTQERSVIDKLLPIAPVQVNTGDLEIAKEAVTVFKATLKTIDDYTALMPEAMKVKYEAGMKIYTDGREVIIKGILDNSKEFTEAELTVMEDTMLTKLSKLANVVVDYSGQSAGGTTKKEEIVSNSDILFPAGVEIETKK